MSAESDLLHLNLCGSLFQWPLCLFSRAIELDLLLYIVKILMYNQFCACLVKMSRVRAGRSEVTSVVLLHTQLKGFGL